MWFFSVAWESLFEDNATNFSLTYFYSGDNGAEYEMIGPTILELSFL